MQIQGGSADGAVRLRICWGIGAVWLVCFLSSLLFPAVAPVLAGIHTLMLIAIVVVHSSLLYGWAGASLYLAVGAVIGFVLEASSVANGFPFGSYVHNSPGPKPFGVPIGVVLVYVISGWYAWCIGRSVTLDQPNRIFGLGKLASPIIGALVLAGLDYPFDPISATVQDAYTFAHPSGQFGVPLTNYLGWIFTGWVLFQLFALLEHRFKPAPVSARKEYWLLPCLIWLLIPVQLLFSWAAAPDGTVSVGRSTFVIADIYEAGFAGALFSMVLPAFAAIVRLLSSQPASTRHP